MVHAAADGLVPTDQTQQMAARLAQVGVPAEVYAVGTTGPASEPGTTLDGYLPVSHPEPLAGHGSEGSNTQIVIQTGLSHLDAILQGREPWPSPGLHEGAVDGTLGTIPPQPGGAPPGSPSSQRAPTATALTRGIPSPALGLGGL